MNAEGRARVLARANGRCECGCGAPIPPGEVDHFWGRAKADETEANCWALTPRCHFEKTSSHPSAAEWLRRFVEHATAHGYDEARQRAQLKLLWVETRASFGRKNFA